jgi:GT2 family glycosyltransferase
MPDLVYIIIPVHNRKHITIACLEHLKSTGALSRYNVVVVDDASTDGTAKAIQQFYPDVHILFGDGDLWWTGAIAKGMEYAIQQGAKYLFWLNDDCIPRPDALPVMLEFMQTHKNALVGAACYCLDSSSPFPTGFRGRTTLVAYPDQTMLVDGVSGYCVGIPAIAIAKIGLPDAKRFPHYGGDGMYTRKATRQGFQVYILGKAKVKLVGEVKPPHQFHDSFRASKFNLGFVFWSKKSPFYLPFQFWHHIDKYGWILGLLLFLAKLSRWTCQWLWMKVKDE